MAIDTLQKRCSALNVGTVQNVTVPPADSSINQADRQHVAHHYSGILAAIETNAFPGDTAWEQTGPGEATLARSGPGEAAFATSGPGEATFDRSGPGEATWSRAGPGDTGWSRRES